MPDPNPELLALAASLDGLARRLPVLAQAETARGREDLATELYEVERSLLAALRRLNRANSRG